MGRGWTHSYNARLISRDGGVEPATSDPTNSDDVVSSIVYVDERGESTSLACPGRGAFHLDDRKSPRRLRCARPEPGGTRHVPAEVQERNAVRVRERRSVQAEPGRPSGFDRRPVRQRAQPALRPAGPLGIHPGQPRDRRPDGAFLRILPIESTPKHLRLGVALVAVRLRRVRKPDQRYESQDPGHAILVRPGGNAEIQITARTGRNECEPDRHADGRSRR